MAFRDEHYCEKHKREMTGFQNLYCPDCVREEDAKATVEDELVATAHQRNLLSKFANGASICISGPIAHYRITRTQRSGDWIVGDLICMGQLVRFTIMEPQQVSAFSNFGGTSRAIIDIVGSVRLNVEHSDLTTDDVLVKSLTLKK